MKLRPSPAFFAGALCCAASLTASPLLLYQDTDDDLRVRCIDTALATGYSAPGIAAAIPNGYSLAPGYWSIDPYVEPAGDDEGPRPAREVSFFAGNSQTTAAWALACISAVDLEGSSKDRLDPHPLYASDIPPAGMAFGFLLICVLGREPLHRRKRRWEQVKPEPSSQ